MDLGEDSDSHIVKPCLHVDANMEPVYVRESLSSPKIEIHVGDVFIMTLSLPLGTKVIFFVRLAGATGTALCRYFDSCVGSSQKKT